MAFMFLNANAFNQDISSWDFTGLNFTTGLFDFLNNTAMSVANYDALLISLNNQAASMPSGMNFGAAGLDYTRGGAAEAARTNLINTYGWTITDVSNP